MKLRALLGRRRQAHHLGPPSHFRDCSSPLACSAGVSLLTASSSSGSPFPAVLATQCHFMPSILSSDEAVGRSSRPRARRFCAIGLFCLDALRNSAIAACWFRGVPVPL